MLPFLMRTNKSVAMIMGGKRSGEDIFFVMVKKITTQVIFYILCAVAVVVPSIAEEKCDDAASDIGFLEVEDRDN